MLENKTLQYSSEELEERFGITSSEDLSQFTFVKNHTNIIPYLFAKERKVLPLEEKEGKVLVATCYPFEADSFEELQLYLGKKVQFIYATREVLEEAIEACFHQKPSKEVSDKTVYQTENEETREGYDLLEQNSDHPVVRILNTCFIEAIRQNASDIHFEPQKQGIVVRFRIDGALQTRFTPPAEYQAQLLTRIKVMAQLDIAERRLPQDGRMKLKMGQREIDFRVSTIPVVYGERIVLRVLDKKNLLLGLDHTGMKRELLLKVRKLLRASEGMILVTGPTGSGKTTTLYSALSEIDAGKHNIMTVEDPIEYELQSIAQIGVNPKIDLSFSKGLRHILRQDPDVIMIGEIRDPETAEIAIQAALTGHLVFSTLHTNDAPSAVARLCDMGVEPYLISSSIIGVLAQRLVRKICPNCKTSYSPSVEEKRELGIEKEVLFYRGNGCENCFFTGYKGRTGIYELMLMSSTLKKQILTSMESSELRNASPFVSLREEGTEKVLLGETTSDEVIRVSRMMEQ